MRCGRHPNPSNEQKTKKADGGGEGGAAFVSGKMVTILRFSRRGGHQLSVPTEKAPASAMDNENHQSSLQLKRSSAVAPTNFRFKQNGQRPELQRKLTGTAQNCPTPTDPDGRQQDYTKIQDLQDRVRGVRLRDRSPSLS